MRTTHSTTLAILNNQVAELNTQSTPEGGSWRTTLGYALAIDTLVGVRGSIVRDRKKHQKRKIVNL